MKMDSKKYCRVLLGEKHKFVDLCYQNCFVGLNFDIKQDIQSFFCDNYQDSNDKLIPVFWKNRPGKSKQLAGRLCAAIWMLCKWMNKGDVVLCPQERRKFFNW